MTFNLSDYIVISLYFLLILIIGFSVSKRNSDENQKEDFLLAGRKLTLPFFVATLVATWYGNILGIGEFVYNDGIVAWVCFGLPYYISAALFAFFIAKKIRKLNVSTIPEQITRKFGKKAGWISSLIVLIITIPAAYILMLGVIVQIFTGWELWLSLIFGAVLSLIYIYSGGFKADVMTNTIQFVIMYLGFFILFFFTIGKFGDIETMLNKLPEVHLQFTGKYSWQFLLVWFFISLQTFVDPAFHQRCSAVKEPKTAQTGLYISLLCWVIFDFLTITTGLYAKAYLLTDNALMSYPILAESVLPPIWKGFFVVTLLSVVMSTLDSYSFISATTIGNDIIAPFKQAKGKAIDTKKLIRLGLIITAVLGVIMSAAFPSAVGLIYKTSSIAVPGLCIPMLLTFSSKLKLESTKIPFIMLLPSLVSLIWTALNIIAGYYSFPESRIFIDIEPMIPGFFVSILLSILFVRIEKVKEN